MSLYTDIFVVPIPKARSADYRRLAETAESVWREHGALSYIEVEADDVQPGMWTSFPRSIDLKDEEFVVVALITYRSRAHRDEVNAKAMADPRMKQCDPKSLPPGGKRMFWGGFKPFVGRHHAVAPAVQPYLFFRGRCEEAMAYYEDTLGARIGLVMRFKDNPDMPPRDKVSAALDDKIMHAEINIAGTDLMMSDGMKSGPVDFTCMSLSLTVATEAEADRLFGALARNGKIEMPIGPSFFAKRFGAVADKFGVSWMIMVPQAP
jgi:PhnB protein